MTGVLHHDGPDDARRRLEFMGVPEGEASALLRELRLFLIRAPRGGAAFKELVSLLDRLGIPRASGGGAVFFSVSSIGQIDRWAGADPGAAAALRPVREAIARYTRSAFRVACREKILALGDRTRIMGILNVTPDSFSDGGRHASFEDAVRHGLAMAAAGADIIDVGGESTRPGSEGVSAATEKARVIPVVKALAGATDALISVDTTKACVAREAAAAGARIVNDTSALAGDPEMAAVVRETGCAAVLMHRRGTPATMQRAPAYRHLFPEILEELAERVAAAESAGIPPDRILVDPGIGFGKRPQDNLFLHRHLPELRNLGKPILVGPSRKSFIGRVTGKDAGDRLLGTAASVAIAAAAGAHVVRVHDVEEMEEVVRVADAIGRGTEC